MKKQGIQANSKNCGSPSGNKFDLDMGQRSKSPHGSNRKGMSQWLCMPHINTLSLILQKIWARLKFLWQTDRRMRFNVPRFCKRQETKINKVTMTMSCACGCFCDIVSTIASIPPTTSSDVWPWLLVPTCSTITCNNVKVLLWLPFKHTGQVIYFAQNMLIKETSYIFCTKYVNKGNNSK